MYLNRLFLLSILFLVLSCQQDRPTEEEPGSENGQEQVIESLPFTRLDLASLDHFQAPSDNWSIAGKVIADYSKEGDLQPDEGTGILVNQPSDNANGNLLTTWEHQDLELKLSFLMPKGSNSGIYLQGRYEIQLFDSWLKKDLKVADCGAIYQRWDEAKQKGYEGHPPPLNVSKAPGLWQDLYIRFRAPRFNEQGEKVSNAMFEKVEMNGVLLHENVELTGPTRASVADNEVAAAPLMIQGDHGPVAIKNFEYKSYSNKVLAITDLQYEYYDIGHPLNRLPNFDTLSLTSSGPIDSFIVTKAATKEDEFALRFKGKLQVEEPGEYLFHLRTDDGSRLRIDGKEIILNDFNHGVDEVVRKLINLSEGAHELQLDYYNNTWGKGIIIMYEGPRIKYQALASPTFPENLFKNIQPLVIETNERPELLRGFLNYGEEKRTHIISVGQPSGLHYAIDLSNGALIKFWRGEFVDVAEMWRGRGYRQLIKPLALAIDGLDAPIAGSIPDASATSSNESGLKLDRYELDDQGYPEFFFDYKGASFSEKITSASDSELLRRIKFVSGDPSSHYTVLGRAKHIEQISNNYYSVGGQYFIKVNQGESALSIREVDQEKEIIYSFDQVGASVEYAILW